MQAWIRGFRDRTLRALVAGTCVLGVPAGCQAAPTTTTSPSTTIPISDIPFGTITVSPTSGPRVTSGSAGDDGAIVEARRMADYVTGPWEVDPALIRRHNGYGADAIVSPNLAILALPYLRANVAALIENHHFINGFTSSRNATDPRVMTNTVLRFASPEDAAAVADGLHAFAREIKVAAPPVEDVPIPGHPETRAVRYTDGSGQRSNVYAFTAHGPYLLAQEAGYFEGAGTPVNIVAKTLDAQVPLIDAFPATDPTKFADLPRDPTGLLARTVPATDISASLRPLINATYARRGFLHLTENPVSSSELFDATGMDLVAFGLTNVYETGDAGGAGKLAEGLVQEAGAGGGPADPVDGVESSACVKTVAPGFYCTATADRYAMDSSAPGLPDAQKHLAEQYKLLVK